MFSVIELFFGIGGQEEFYSITLKMFFRSDHWPCAGGPFVPNWGIHSPLRGLFVIKGAIVRGNENSLDNELKSDAVEA